MSKPRITTLISSAVLASGLAFFLFGEYVFWSATLIYFLHIFLAAYFFAILISNQQYKEDFAAKGERVLGAILFSYVFFLQMFYAPTARYFFGSLIEQRSFLSDFMALLLFLFFLFLFLTSTFALAGFSRGGFLSNWSVLNNPTSYFVLRNLFFPALLLTVFLFWQMPFIIITV
ncbi:MAG: hypothetical protein QMD77_03275 [Patescibacteria group bacterium]|nr:hypothetical protein [Patescibacteria group bacterium]